jgi:hypothetical protein
VVNIRDLVAKLNDSGLLKDLVGHPLRAVVLNATFASAAADATVISLQCRACVCGVQLTLHHANLEQMRDPVTTIIRELESAARAVKPSATDATCCGKAANGTFLVPRDSSDVQGQVAMFRAMVSSWTPDTSTLPTVPQEVTEAEKRAKLRKEEAPW